MAGPIQTIPQGLLGLLQLKELGRNPRDLLEVVQPSMEMLPFMLNRQTVDIGKTAFGTPTFTFSLATAAPGQGYKFTTPGSIQVPQNQMWWVTQYEAHTPLLAAETIRFRCSTLTGTNSNVFALGNDVADVITARARYVSCFANGFWALPGAHLTVDIFDDLTAGTITVTGGVVGVIIPI